MTTQSSLMSLTRAKTRKIPGRYIELMDTLGKGKNKARVSIGYKVLTVASLPTSCKGSLALSTEPISLGGPIRPREILLL